MAKNLNHFFCKECGYETIKWLGQCPSCKRWNTIVEAPKAEQEKSRAFSRVSNGVKAEARKLKDIELAEEDRMKTGFSELDRVLGGGIVKGSLLLLCGDPGIGKSTILLSLSLYLGSTGKRVLYVSGEESLKQIKLRAERMMRKEGDVFFLSETNVEKIADTIRELQAEFLVIDSIQTMFLDGIPSSPGSVSQVRECTAFLLRLAKENGIAVGIVGHVTKDGNVAGPKILEHMVDAVLYFEGERNTELRILYGQKNRFGSTNEIAVFRMEAEGLEEVKNPSEFLLSGRALSSPGSVVSSAMEGTRPLLMEIQGLLVPTSFGIPRRTANGMDYNRLNMLLAVMERSLGISCSKYDAYINITGGMRISEPAIDLAIILSLLSSYRNLPVSEDIMVFGEVGLSGEVRAVIQGKQRIEEAKRLGFHHIILPAYHLPKEQYDSSGIHLIPVKNIREALTIFKS